LSASSSTSTDEDDDKAGTSSASSRSTTTETSGYFALIASMTFRAATAVLLSLCFLTSRTVFGGVIHFSECAPLRESGGVSVVKWG